MPTQLLIDGEWAEASSGETRAVLNPATGKPIAEMGIGTEGDVDRAVRSARTALEDGPWSRMSGYERRKLLLAFAREVSAAAEEIGATESQDMGMPQLFAQGAVAMASETLEYFAGWADKIGGQTIPTPSADVLDYTIRHPVGVVAAIVPWNSPTFLSIAKLGPALAAGCTVVLKPSEEAPLAPLKLGECAQKAGFPPGVLNIVTGEGPDAGAALVAHPGVDKISFTGGTELGRHIGQEAAKRFARVSLELGGKSANIVFADANLDEAAVGAVMAFMLNSGQQCIAGSRLLIERSVYDEFLERVKGVASGFQVGMPDQPTTQLGPIINQRQLDRVLGFVEEADDAGRVVLGGERLGGDLADGFFVAPTIVADTDHSSRLWNEEVFGPVVAATPFDTPAEAISIANDTRYGLAGGVWTKNLDVAHGVAGAIRTGTMWVNSYLNMFPGAPFGGFKESGQGREGGLAAVHDYTETTNVYVNLANVRS